MHSSRWAPTRHLPVLETIRTALRVLFARPRHFASLIVVPAVPSVLLAMQEPREGNMVWNLMLGVLSMLPLVLFAVWCHRSILLDSSGVLWFGSLEWGERENRFAAWMVGVYFVLVPTTALGLLAPLLLVSKIVSPASPWQDFATPSAPVLVALFLTPIGYVVARSLFVFPATAVDLRPSLSSAWRLSHGNGWRLALVLVALPYALHFAAGSAVEALPSKGWAQAMGAVVSDYTVGLFEVALLSVAFRSLASEDLLARPAGG